MYIHIIYFSFREITIFLCLNLINHFNKTAYIMNLLRYLFEFKYNWHILHISFLYNSKYCKKISKFTSHLVEQFSITLKLFIVCESCNKI